MLPCIGMANTNNNYRFESMLFGCFGWLIGLADWLAGWLALADWAGWLAGDLAGGLTR